MFSSVASLAPQHFSTLSHKRYDFGGGKKNVMENKIYVLIFSESFYKTFPILRVTEPRIIINVHRSLRKVPVIPIIF